MFNSVRSRVLTTFGIAMVLILIVVGVAAYQYSNRYQSELVDDYGHAAVASIEALFESLALHTSEPKPGTKHYETYRKKLREICKAYDMDYLYLYRADPATDKRTYLMCVAYDDKDDEQINLMLVRGEMNNTGLDDQEKSALAGKDVTEPIAVDNRYGQLLMWVAKVDGWDNVLVGADFSIPEQRALSWRIFLMVATPLVVTLTLLLAVQLWTLRNLVFDPLQAIANQMRTFNPEQAGVLEPIAVRSKDEIGEIATAFEGMTRSIATYTDEIRQLTEERVQAEVELDVARRIQLGLVPAHTELKVAAFDIAAVSRPARAVGGDLYDVFAVDETHVALIVGDVSGKGVAAALFMATTKAMMHDGFLSGGSPVEVLIRINTELCMTNPEGMFVTAFVGILDVTTGELRYTNAGHTPPLVMDEHGTSTLEVDTGMLLGLFDDVELEEGTVRLKPGEAMLLYTDGATEAVGPEKTMFGKRALMTCLSDAAPYEHATSIVDTVVSAVDTFVGSAEQFDDLTLVALLRQAANGR